MCASVEVVVKVPECMSASPGGVATWRRGSWLVEWLVGRRGSSIRRRVPVSASGRLETTGEGDVGGRLVRAIGAGLVVLGY